MINLDYVHFQHKTVIYFVTKHLAIFTQLAFSQKRSQCILGSFGGTKYMVTGIKYVKE
jgi:hypothetical protein